MQALARLPPAQGIAAMQSINVAAITPVFMGALFGTRRSVRRSGGRRAVDVGRTRCHLGAVGGLLYLVGAIAVTMAFNAPRNNALAAVVPESAEGVGLWARYVTEWAAWNHVRTGACLAAAAALTLALR